MNAISYATTVSAITVFLQGILNFFSPCVLPILPLYIGYLSGGTLGRDDAGRMMFDRRKVLIHTICFILGVSAALFLLGLGISTLSTAIHQHQRLITLVGGILIILIGLYQLGVFGSSAFLEQERRLPLHLERWAMTPITALLMGFVFSFSWTPCIGPTLSSVLIMAASAESRTVGFLLIGLYTLGFCLPFLAVGLFASTLLDWLRNHRGVVRYTVIIGAILMIIVGILMATGMMDRMSRGLAASGTVTEEESSAEESSGEESVIEESSVEESSEESIVEEEESSEESSEDESSDADPERPMAMDFTLVDQFGETRSLSDYKGKVIFLNFWATWCPPCRAEMPDIQAIYEKYKDSDNVAILGVALPDQGGEGSVEEIAAFLAENGYTYPVVMDDGVLTYYYQISAYPTTFMIQADGTVYGYVTGSISQEVMQDIIDQTLEAAE